MESQATTDFESESSQLVEEFIRRDLVSPEVADRAATLEADDAPFEALEVILHDRRERRTDGR